MLLVGQFMAMLPAVAGFGLAAHSGGLQRANTVSAGCGMQRGLYVRPRRTAFGPRMQVLAITFVHVYVAYMCIMYVRVWDEYVYLCIFVHMLASECGVGMFVFARLVCEW